MKTFEEKKFNIGELVGISAQTIEEHLKLYAGYVKNTNAVLQKIEELSADKEKNSYAIGEMNRRFSFEYNGMRNHEVYFDSLSDGAAPLSETGYLTEAISEEWGSVETWLEDFKSAAGATRGVGWQVLWYDKKADRLISSWVDEQHFGQLQECVMILGLDMWEHSYVADYRPSGKKKYIEDFFANLNWKKIEDNFDAARK